MSRIEPQVWPAPAKLNLFLHVLGRRADGYHELQTVFQLLDYCDELTFEVNDDGEIRREEGAPGVPPESDLVVRAARLLKDSSGTDKGVAIRLRKRIPAGGGLGGGSSDAATTLSALNRLWSLGLGPSELGRLGLELGADVPVFLAGHSAWAEGVGERLETLELPERWYVVIAPDCEVSTAEVFADPALTRNSSAIKIPGFLVSGGRNDCLGVVRRRYPEVAAALDWLSQHGEARLTGTGACVFAGFGSRGEAERVYQSRPDGWRGFVARGINRSPLLDL